MRERITKKHIGRRARLRPDCEGNPFGDSEGLVGVVVAVSVEPGYDTMFEIHALGGRSLHITPRHWRVVEVLP